MCNQRASGFPEPDLYNQHFINKYSFPKGLQCGRKPEHMRKKEDSRYSIYDIQAQPVRTGVTGWKLTKKMPSMNSPEVSKGIGNSPINSTIDNSFDGANLLIP